MPMLPLATQTYDELASLCHQHGIIRLQLFGSVSRHEETAQSDLDLLVEFARPQSLLTLVGVEEQLTDLLGRQVDLLTPNAISPYLRDKIAPDLQTIYETKEAYETG